MTVDGCWCWVARAILRAGTETPGGVTQALERDLAAWFGGEPQYRWSAHDYVPVDGLPYIGRLTPLAKRLHVATGFAKWGLTKGTLAAMILTDAIVGRPNPLGTRVRCVPARSHPLFRRLAHRERPDWCALRR